jgi:hypothetical protein
MPNFEFKLNFKRGKNPTNLSFPKDGNLLEEKYLNSEGKNQLIPFENKKNTIMQFGKKIELLTSTIKEKSKTKQNWFKSFNFFKFNNLNKDWFRKNKLIFGLFGSGIVVSVIIISLLLNQKVTNKAQGSVAGVIVKSVTKNNQPTDAYKSWIADKLGQYYGPEEDFDTDQLSNEEEFIIGTDPKNEHTCNPDKTDAENLVELINPITCKLLDLSDEKSLEKFKKVVDFNAIKSKVFQSDAKNPKTEIVSENTDSILKQFNIDSLESLNKQEFNNTKLKAEQEAIRAKQFTIDKINKINQYMKETRSLEPYDRNNPIPVNGAVYLEVALKYKAPLKYVLAVAQRESRFGTDAFDKDGNLTRPGKYKNIFSMGLDDEGNNVGFETWEKGVESFGRWYKRFNDRGFSDCSKWRIYNPNGDYCKAIEETASGIEAYLNK